MKSLMNNLNLADLQRAVQDFLLDESQRASELTLETPKFSRSQRLDIYYQAYRLRLIDALRNDYPALESYVGKDAFCRIGEAFIAQYPSRHASLRWLGEKLPSFLRENEEWHSHPIIVELAEFEWAQAMAFDASDTSPITLENLRSLPAEQWMTLKLAFHPSVQLHSFFTNAPTLWQSLIKEQKSIAVETHETPRHWLIWREELQVVYQPLEKPEAHALHTFSDQNTFTDVCEGLCEWFTPEQVPLKAAQYLQQWIRGGLVTGIR